MYFSKSAGEYSGYVPKVLQLFGVSDFVAWGLQAGGIGTVLILFISIIFLSLLKFKKIDKIGKYYLVLSGVLFFLVMGGLGQYYPCGVDPVRFVLPFAILLIIASSVLIVQNKIFKKKIFLILLILLLIGGLIWNSSIINQNFNKFSYNGEDSRYGIFENIMSNPNFPLKNEFTNYRFGTSKYVFGENLNYFMPQVSQTFGYQDAGMLNAPRYYDMRWHIWTSENINDSIYWLDWFGIKYFEVKNSDVSDKFVNDSRFVQIMNGSQGYDFVLYEYKNAKPVISLVDSLNNGTLGNSKDFSVERENPDEIKITYDNFEKGNVVVFKDFYNKNWVAKDLDSGEKLKVVEVGPGFMAVYPNENSKGIELYYQKNFIEWFSIFLSLVSFIFLILFWKNKRFKHY